MKSRGLSRKGSTLVNIGLVIALLGIVALIIMGTSVRPVCPSQKLACINNLRQIDDAKRQWALDSRQANNAAPTFTTLGPDLKHEVVCPASGDAGATFSDSYHMNNLRPRRTGEIVPATHVLPPDTPNASPSSRFGFGWLMMGFLVLLVVDLGFAACQPAEPATFVTREGSGAAAKAL
jgi:hypothetical protein